MMALVPGAKHSSAGCSTGEAMVGGAGWRKDAASAVVTTVRKRFKEVGLGSSVTRRATGVGAVVRQGEV